MPEGKSRTSFKNSSLCRMGSADFPLDSRRARCDKCKVKSSSCSRVFTGDKSLFPDTCATLWENLWEVSSSRQDGREPSTRQIGSIIGEGKVQHRIHEQALFSSNNKVLDLFLNERECVQSTKGACNLEQFTQ